MAYQYILRKYKLPKAGASRFAAMGIWREIVAAGQEGSCLVDEFAVEDKPKRGWLGGVMKQLLG